jgi:shikimate kinase
MVAVTRLPFLNRQAEGAVMRRHLPVDRPVTWVALAGFMGSGKSRIGWELSRRLALTFIDTDRVIERVSCMRIPDIFDLYGESVFRDYETEVVKRCLKLDEVVVSTGGGTVLRSENREMLKSRGPVIVLTASAETTYRRTRRHKRPLLEVGNPIDRIRELMTARQAAYDDVATFKISTDERPSQEVVNEIVQKLSEWRRTNS